ncbi:MAG TPA: hypothetical protein VJB95_03415 [Candidatus Paceibacterota bacterium]
MEQNPFSKTPFEKPLADLFKEGEVVVAVAEEDSEDTQIKRERLKMLEDREDKVVRLEDPHFTDTTEEALFYKDQEKQFNRLREFGISVPKISVVIGQIEEKKKIFIIADKVEGVHLHKIELSDSKMVAEVDEFYARLLGYYLDTYRRGLPIFTDIADFQFIYGKTTEQIKNSFYMVDVGTGNFSPTSDPNYDQRFKRVLDVLFREISEIKSDKKLAFPESTKKINEVKKFWLSQIPQIKDRKDRIFFGRQPLGENLRKLKDLYKDEIPTGMIHGNMPDHQFKADKNWFNSLNFHLVILLEDIDLGDTVVRKIQEFRLAHSTVEWDNRPTTEADIREANNLISFLLKSIPDANLTGPV